MSVKNSVSNEKPRIKKLIEIKALKLFSINGTRKTSVDDIAKEANVAKGSIYNYFNDKTEILQSQVSEGDRLVEDRVRLAMSREKTAKTKLKVLVLEKIRFFKEMVDLYDLKNFMNENFVSEVEHLRNGYFEKEKLMIKQVFSYGVKNKEIKKLNKKELDVLTNFFAREIKGLENTWTLKKDYGEIEKTVDFLLAVLFNGLKTK